MSDMYTVGMPSIKLSETEGKGGKHSGNFYKVAAEALEERQGKDLDINHEQSHLNVCEGFKSAAELKAYSDNWIAEFNAAVEKNDEVIKAAVKEYNEARAANGEKKMSEKEALKAINKQRKNDEEPPLEKQRKIRKDAVVMCTSIVKPPKLFMDTLTQEQQKEFFKKSLEKFKDIVGADNVKAAVVHYDELVPHLHIFWQPVTADGRLCAKEMHNIKFLGRLNREMPKYLRDAGFNIGDCDAYDVEEAQKIREEKGDKAYREYNEQRRRERAEKGKKSGQDSIVFKSDADKAAAATQQATEIAKQQQKEAERAAEQAQQRLKNLEWEAAELQDAVDEFAAQKDELQEEIEAANKALSEVQERQKQAEVELVKMQEIPSPPKKPFDRKPTAPIAVSKAEFIRSSVSSNLGLFERRKREKEVGESYDREMQQYQNQLAQWEQYERDYADYKERYGLTEAVQRTAEQQAQTATAQERTAAQQAAERAEINAAQEAVKRDKATLDAEKRNLKAAVTSQARKLAERFGIYDKLMSVNAAWSSRYEQIFGKPYREQQEAPRQEQQQDKGGLTR